MSNHLWVCPTKNQDEFYNIGKLMPLLKEEFPQLGFNYEDITHDDLQHLGHCINVYNSKIDSLFLMECYNDCYFIDKHNKSDIIEELDQMGRTDLSDNLIEYMENGLLDPEKCIEIRRTGYSEEINAVCRWMRWYFGAIVFDEGIHPVFLSPLKDKPDTKISQGFIKSFKTWLLG